ncbi:HEAT repeat domain-containing protein [bacterium]|nr:HEAT repeat domain-containing protein [bacterium]
MSRRIGIIFLTLLFVLASAETKEPPTTIGPFPADPLQAKRHREHLELIGELEAGRIELEDAVEDLSEIISDPREEPGLRTTAADHLGKITVEVRQPDGTVQDQPRALAAALSEAAATYDPHDWPLEYLKDKSREPAILVGLMVDDKLLDFHLTIALDDGFALEARLAAVGVIGAIEGTWAFEMLTELAADGQLDEELRIAAIGALAPIGYDEGRDFLERLSRSSGLSPRLKAAIEEGLETIERTQYMTPGAWIMFAVGVILLFGGSAWFVRIALRRGKKHIFSDESGGEGLNG